jgi:pyruvate dehydrogenase E2 component (dihydrolipoamide acetyltransferase)
MATDIVMPRLSDSMEEGTILTWMKQVGDPVALGEELVEIETDKANMVFESDAAGTLVEILAGEGDTLPIGEVIARVGDAGEAPAGGGEGGSAATGGEGGEADRGGSAVHAPQEPRVLAPDPPSSPTPSPTQQVDAPEPASLPAPSTGGRIKASPVARRIAEEKGVDLSALQGSGPGGRIIKVDVLKAGSGTGAAGAADDRSAAKRGQGGGGTPAPAPATTPPSPETAKGAVEVVELTKLQQTVGRRMAESKATAPHFYLQSEIDMTKCFEARAALKASASEGDVIPSFNDMVVKACAIALREFPRANGAYRDGKWELYERVNVGIAVAAAEALVVPTIFDADRKGLRQIASESRALAGKVRDQKITPPELSGGTFTVSNLGMYGVTNFHPVINLPQAAILAVGAITETPVIRGGEISSARLMGVTLACDHRILYGADGAEFLARIRALLEEPLGLAL